MTAAPSHQDRPPENSQKWRLAWRGLVAGLVAGVLAVLYRLLIQYGTDVSVVIFARIRAQPVLLVPWLVAVAAIGWLVALAVRREPMAGGSGIPQVKGIVLFGLRMRWYSVLAVRFTAGVACSFFGLSLGREGPSIQIGAAGAQAVARRFHASRDEENLLLTGGAAAGLSAAFNAPLSGIVFVIEGIHRSFSPLVLLAATTGSLTADFVASYVFGLRPVLGFVATPQLPIDLYLLVVPLGVAAGVVGAATNRGLLGFQALYRRLPAVARPSVAMLVALPCGLAVPLVLGGGERLVEFAERAQDGVLLLVLLAAIKLVFTSTSFGSGVPGGIFMPILAIGTLVGSAFGIACTHLGMAVGYVPAFAVCAMAGLLSSTVKAPVTSVLLTAEMAGSLVHLLPVTLCAFVALLTSDALRVPPIYDALLRQTLETQGPGGTGPGGTGPGDRGPGDRGPGDRA